MRAQRRRCRSSKYVGSVDSTNKITSTHDARQLKIASNSDSEYSAEANEKLPIFVRKVDMMVTRNTSAASGSKAVLSSSTTKTSRDNRLLSAGQRSCASKEPSDTKSIIWPSVSSSVTAHN